MINLSIPDYISKPVTSQAWVDLTSQWETPEETEYAELQILDYPLQGIQIYVNSRGLVVTIFLFNEGVENHQRSVVPLPFGLNFSFSSDAVTDLLGNPTHAGVSEKGFAWKKYTFANYAVHIEFIPEKTQIRMVTVMADMREITGE